MAIPLSFVYSHIGKPKSKKKLTVCPNLFKNNLFICAPLACARTSSHSASPPLTVPGAEKHLINLAMK